MRIKKNIYLKTGNGITLLSLVIAIIILLILSTITLSALTGDNGLISRVKQAKVTSEMEELREKAELIKGKILRKKTKEGKDATKSDLVNEIMKDKDFSGKSKKRGNRIIVDDKYEISIDDDLEINVSEMKGIEEDENTIYEGETAVGDKKKYSDGTNDVGMLLQYRTVIL